MGEAVNEERLDSPAAKQLLDEFVAEIAALYPGWTPGSGPSAEPADFEPPDGTFLVVSVDGVPAGCGGLKRIGPHSAEIKRMYVRPHFRRRGLGRRVIADLEGAARARSYEVVRLDTGAEQPGAVRLFLSAGYREIADYNGNRFARHWFEKVLR